MQKRHNVTHTPQRRSRGGLRSSGFRAVRELLQQEHFGGSPPWLAVIFKCLFRSGPGSAGFRVREGDVEPPKRKSAEEAISMQRKSATRYLATDEIFRTLATLQSEQVAVNSTVSHLPVKSQLSPWLERTRWPSYLNGTRLRDAAQLARDSSGCPLNN